MRYSVPVVPREVWCSIQQHIEYVRHLAAYELLARPLINDKAVLDIGCGAGYGAYGLANRTDRIVGIDISSGEVLPRWLRYHQHGGPDYAIADAIHLPFRDECFDIVLSFQVIEHIRPADVAAYLSEIRRVLRQGGFFVCSTPNRRLRLLPFQRPWNPEHHREFDSRQLQQLLTQSFTHVELLGLCAVDDIHTIECNRVKQTPWKAYVVPGIRRLGLNSSLAQIRRPLRQIAHLACRRHTHDRLDSVQERRQVSLGDFWVDNSCPQHSLDVYAICTKDRRRKRLPHDNP